MRTYVFKCTKCRNTEEVVRDTEARNLSWYCECGGEMRRVYLAPHIIYVPGGFYTTDKRLDPTQDDFDDDL